MEDWRLKKVRSSGSIVFLIETGHDELAPAHSTVTFAAAFKGEWVQLVPARFWLIIATEKASFSTERP